MGGVLRKAKARRSLNSEPMVGDRRNETWGRG